MPTAFLGVAFFLGAFITNYFKSKKINALILEAQETQTRFYALQNSSKKQLAEQATTINKLRKGKSALAKELTLVDESSTVDHHGVQDLKDKNLSLKKELKNLAAKNKELKVEKAVIKVDKKYPMQLYGMNDEQSNQVESEEVKILNKKPKLKKSKLRKLKSKIILSDDDGAENKKELPKKSTVEKSKKPKKKSKSKKRKSKKVLALVSVGKKNKKKKSKKKNKKNKKK